MRVDQLIPAFHRGDAIGDTASHMKRFLRSRGFESEIYCLNRDKGLENDSVLFDEFPPPDPGDAVILHYALVSPMTAAFAELSARKAIIYHNVTPPHFFRAFSPEMARICRLSREQLEGLAPTVHLAMADSEVNRRELEEMGFRPTSVLPLFVDFTKYEGPASPMMTRLLDDGRTNILFVGRIVPNKRIEDLIKVLFYTKKYISPLVRLIVVGKTSSMPGYYRSLVRLADEFFLMPEEMLFTGHVSDAELISIYRSAHVFLSLSEHEGFGLPFIESLVFDLPVVAYDCTAVRDTMGEAGVLIRDKGVGFVAELVDIVARDKALRERIIRGQRKRLRQYKDADLEGILIKNVEKLLA